MNRFQYIYAIGCLPCRQRGWFQPCQAHHLNRDGKAGQKRRGDRFTIGICPWHHQGQSFVGMTEKQCTAFVGPSLALNSRAFRREFGTDDQLLARQDELIEERKRLTVGAVA